MNVYQLIEQLGARAAFEGESVPDSLELDPELRRALEEKDQAAVQRLLGGNDQVMMILVPADDDDEEEPADDPGQEEIRKAG